MGYFIEKPSIFDIKRISDIVIGRVLKPRGLKGEVKCACGVTPPDTLFIDGKGYKVIKSSCQNKTWYIYLEGIKCLEDAERLRGKEICAPRESIVIQEDEVLTSELIGFKVTDESGKELGVLRSIDNYGAGEICDCGDFSFPYEDEFVIETNMTDKKIVIKTNQFSNTTMP